MPMASWLKFLLVLIEWGIQLKRQDEYDKKQERLRQARTDPAGYMRERGWLQRNQSGKSDNGLPSDRTNADQHNGE